MIPHFSVVIPTLNEAENLATTITAARAALGQDAEVIVSDGGSHDGTPALARAQGAHLVTHARGRGAQLEAGVRAATGDVCVLLHADTLLPAHAGAQIDVALRTHVGGAFRLRFEDGQLTWLARAINLRSRMLGNATGDQAMFFKRPVLLKAGGIPHVELFEDVRLWQQMKRAGRLTLLEAKVTTSARLWLRVGTLRVIGLHWRLRALHALGVSPRTLAQRYPNGRS